MLIDISSISVSDRQRKVIVPSALTELKESIKSVGLLHPPVVRQESGVTTLVAGERRLRAIKELHESGATIRHNGEVIPPNQIPVTSIHALSLSGLKQAEFDENAQREPLSWQERTQALADLHHTRQEENPTQSYLDTAKEISSSVGSPSESEANLLSGRQGGASTNTLRRAVREAVVLADYLADPEISKARNEKEAFGLLMSRYENAANAELARRAIKGSDSYDIRIRQGDLQTILPGLEDGFVDLIIADPPYGIDAGQGGFRQRTVLHHNYEDDEKTAREIATAILLEGFRICKNQANLFMFCDIRRHNEFVQMAKRIGWTPFETPIIWRKSESEGLAPWGRQGFRRTYETILYATKGSKGLYSSPVDILDEKRVGKHERTHAAEKPVGLLKLLIECSTLPGDFVLDPCCGSGSTLVAAQVTKRKGLGIELNEAYVETAMSNLFKVEQ